MEFRPNFRDDERMLCCEEGEIYGGQIAFALKQAELGTIAEQVRSSAGAAVGGPRKISERE